MNKLIGYLISCGTFTTKSGEEIDYSNRVLRLITDSGANSENIGAAGYEVKIKASVIAQCLKCAENDNAVNQALNSLINKEVRFEYAPVNGVLAVCGFYPAGKEGS